MGPYSVCGIELVVLGSRLGPILKARGKILGAAEICSFLESVSPV